MGMQIDGVIALVTGANRGIGKVITETLLEHGASKVYAAVRDPKSAQPLVDVYGDRVVPLEIDLAKPDTITAAAAAAQDVELVVNNAGVLRVASPLAGDAIEAFQFEMDINVYGLIRVAQAFAPVLKANGGGALVQLNSVASLQSFADFATYSASKAASYSITLALREKLAEQGTRVVSVHPGPIATDMADAAELRDEAESPSVVAEGIVHALETGEFFVFPDSYAKEIEADYRSFGEKLIQPAEVEA